MRKGVRAATVARSPVTALVLAAILAGCGGNRAATTTSATTTSTTTAKASERSVLQAFARVGLQLHNPAPPSSSPHLYEAVTMLTSIRPHDGWTVAAYVYPTRNEANASFDADAGEWSASGIASAHEGNLVVVVIPRGHVLSRRAPVFPMPSLVIKALDLLPHGR